MNAVRHALARGTRLGGPAVERHVENCLGRSEGVTLLRLLSDCRLSRYSPVRACALPRRKLRRPRGSSWKHSRPCLMTPSAPLRSARRTIYLRLGPATSDAVLANVPPGFAFLRALRSRAARYAALAAGYNRQQLAQLGLYYWFMRSFVHLEPGRDGLGGRSCRANSAAWAEVGFASAGRRASSAAFSHARLVRTWA